MVRSQNTGPEHDQAILPPSTIGILGGGQLGQMLALEARAMGYHIITLDPTPGAPCALVADEQVTAAFDDTAAAERMARKCQVITYEFENIGSQVAARLEEHSFLPQGYDLLYTIQNRVREKTAAAEAGLPVAPWQAVSDPTSLHQAVANIGLPAVLKTQEGGYDGKGQYVLHSAQDAIEAEQMLTDHQEPSHPGWILEQFVPFVKELSVIVARNLKGEIAVFPIAENVHRENILHLSMAPARIDAAVGDQIGAAAVQLAETFQLAGLLALELFLTADNRIYLNELAPRPHNSGHYTQAACLTSQFEQHIRAVCNLPLRATDLLRPTLMVNILGEHLAPIIERIPILPPECRVHLYSKGESRPKRKMGHMNVTGTSLEQMQDWVYSLGIWTREDT